MLTIDKTTPTPKPTLPVTRQPKLLDVAHLTGRKTRRHQITARLERNALHLRRQILGKKMGVSLEVLKILMSADGGKLKHIELT